MTESATEHIGSPPHPATTAEVLSAAVDAFIAREYARYGTKLSKRTIVRNFFGDGWDESTLSRWTNPGARKNWTIPTFRIRAVAKILADKANSRFGDFGEETLIHDLMTARLAELSKESVNGLEVGIESEKIGGHIAEHGAESMESMENKEHLERNEALVIATWLAGVLEPSADEAAILGVFQKVFGQYPHRVLSDKGVLAEFEEFFQSKAKKLWDQFWVEHAADAHIEIASKTSAAVLKEVPGGGAESPSVAALLAKTKEQRDTEYSAKYRGVLVIRDIQRRAGIRPMKKVPKKRR